MPTVLETVNSGASGVTFGTIPNDGELILLYVRNGSNTAVTTPSGFTEVSTTSVDLDTHEHVFGRIASSEASATYSHDGSATDATVGQRISTTSTTVAEAIPSATPNDGASVTSPWDVLGVDDFTFSADSLACVHVASTANFSPYSMDNGFSLIDSSINRSILFQKTGAAETINPALSFSGPGSFAVSVFEVVDASGPAITSVTTIKNGESFTITGTNFSASGNSVTLGGVTQTITAESTTEITCTNVRGTLAYGAHDLVVTDDSANSSDPSSETLNPQTGWNHVTLSGVIAFWAGSESVTTGDQRINEGNLYEAATTGTTGPNAPTHTTGTESDGGVDWTWQQAYDRITAVSDLVDGDQVAWGNVQGGAIGDVTVNAPADFESTGVDHTLTSPSATSTGETTADWSVSTDGSSGKLHWVFSTSSTKPTTEQIIAGNDSTGSAAAASGTETVSASGTQTGSGTGLSSGTTYYPHFYHQAGVTAFDVEAHDQTEWGTTATQTVAGEDSSVVSGNGFTVGETLGRSGMVRNMVRNLTGNMVRDVA